MQIITNQFQKELKQHGNFQFPFLISYECLSHYEFGSFLWHWHPEIEITLLTQGEMVYKCNDCIFQPQKGDLIICNSNSFHSGEMKDQKDCEYISITLDTRLIYGYEGSLIQTKYIQPLLQNPAFSGIHVTPSAPWYSYAITIIEEIIHFYEKQSSEYELEITSRLLQFWKLLFQNCESVETISATDRQNYARVRSILEYIEQNYHTKLYLDDIASHIALCKSECCRLFKRHMKISLFEFLLEYRINKSLTFLCDSNYSITEVSEKSGFSDSNYYSKTFKKLKGCSPREYRKRFLENQII